MKVDTDPLYVGDDNFVEPLKVMMVEATEGLKVIMVAKNK